MRYPRNATYRFLIQKVGKQVNVDDLTREEREELGIWAYQTIVKALGYTSANNHNDKCERGTKK